MLCECKSFLSKCFFIPQRYILGFMGFLAVLNAYTMRIILSVAITEMVISAPSSAPSEDSCPSPNSSNSSASVMDVDYLYDWDETTQGLILSSFYYGYVLTHLPGGILAEKFGGKYSLSLGILSTAIFTILTPTVVRIGNWQGLVVLRIFEGFGEGTTYPALNALLAKWVPLHERSKIGTLAFSGSLFGTVLGNALSGAIISWTNTWSAVFYVFGGIGIIWFILFSLICYSSPDCHPFISDKEKQYLKKELGHLSKKKKDIPWRQILTSAPLWALVVSQIGHDWGFFAMVTDLPKYMKDVLKFNVKENGLWSSLPYVVMWIVALSSGVLCDWLIRKKIIGITFARKFFTTIASIGPGVFILLASYVGCDRMLAITLFTIAMGFMGTFYCGMKVNALDLSPNFAGTLMAIVNGVGAISGIIVPYLIGALTEDKSLSQWRLVFWITLVILTVSNLIYCLWASGETQWWDDPDRNTEQIENGNTTKAKE